MANAGEAYRDLPGLRSRAVPALPPEVQAAAQAAVTELADGAIEPRPHVPVPARQAWFWAEAWQSRERQVDEDLAAGRVSHSGDGESFLASLSDADAG